MQPCNYELSDAGSDSEGAVSAMTQVEPNHDDHIQIQMFCQPNQRLESSVISLISVMNATLERNNKAILTLIEVPVHLLREVKSCTTTYSSSRRLSKKTSQDKMSNRANCKQNK